MKSKDLVEEWVKGIKGKTCFPDKFQIIFPTECNGCKEAIDLLRDTMVESFNGSTEWNGYGCWVGEKEPKETVCESVKVLESAHHCADVAIAQKLGNAIIKSAKIADQMDILISAGNKFHLLKGLKVE